MVDGALISTGLTIVLVCVALVFAGAIALIVAKARFPEYFAPEAEGPNPAAAPAEAAHPAPEHGAQTAAATTAATEREKQLV